MATNAAAVRHPLVDQLARRIRGPLDLEEPYIIQDHVPQTRSRHAVIIWDAWSSLDGTDRAFIIVEAFKEAGIADTVRVATGLTQEEALEMGYLSYQIESNWKKSDGPRVLTALQRAMRRAHGVKVRVGSSLQLRYPTLEYAQEAYRQLSAAVPGPYWSIVKEANATD